MRAVRSLLVVPLLIVVSVVLAAPTNKRSTTTAATAAADSKDDGQQQQQKSNTNVIQQVIKALASRDNMKRVIEYLEKAEDDLVEKLPAVGPGTVNQRTTIHLYN